MTGETPPAAYKVTAIMQGRRTRLVISDGDDPYTTTNYEAAKQVLAQVRQLPLAYVDARIEDPAA